MNERLVYYLEKKCGTLGKAQTLLDFPNNTLTHFKSGKKTKMGTDKIQQISVQFPELNLNWLFRGELPEENTYNIDEVLKELEELRTENKVLRKYLPSETPISIAAEKEEKYKKS